MSRQCSQQARLGVPALSSLALLSLGAWSAPFSACAQTISVGPDQALVYPGDLSTIPDQHTTFWPPAAGAKEYLVFAASSIQHERAGMVVLATQNLKTFSYAARYKSPVMAPPIKFTTCKAAYDKEFDENYSAPGTVVQDPTRPSGHLIMIYEAENHCPTGAWQQPLYATVGLARSTDFGKTWPAPVASELGDRDRRPVLKSATAEPTTAETPPLPRGDISPTAFVDSNDKGEHFIYVAYIYVGQGNDGFLRVARAKLDDDKDDRPERRVTFSKWYQGGFSQPGIGGLDSGVTPGRGCPGYQTHGQISYNEAIGRYLLTFVCVSIEGPTGHKLAYQAGWYFSTATSLEQQNWTAPQFIAGSQRPVTPKCAPGGMAGNAFDGWYSSFMSPDHPDGHLGATGQVFFLNGCDANAIGRKFLSRSFTITP